MESINPTILKTTIESIPTLNEDNFSSWRTRITALFKLSNLKDSIYLGSPPLSDEDNTILCAIIIAKLSPGTHSNVVNSSNEDDAHLLWKAIEKRFMSSEPSNRARVYNQFASITFDSSNIEKFITDVRFSLTKMEEVGIILPKDIITYDLMRRLPSTLDSVKQRVTNNKENITPEFFLNNMEIYQNEIKISNLDKPSFNSTVLFTQTSTKCRPGQHNDKAPHPKHRCFMLYPELREKYNSNLNKVSSFLSFHSNNTSIFILDSGSSSHMVSDINLFFALEQSNQGMINTSCGLNKLSIEGKGSIKLKIKNEIHVFHNVLYVPNITVNLLSLHQLLLDSCNVKFDINHFQVTKNNKLLFEGHYQNNIPVIEIESDNHQTHLSSAELLHKSLGHVSYHRIRHNLGIPVKPPEVCKSCSVVKITKASFNHRRSHATRPFEEIHLDLIGPITPVSINKHRYILTVVDSNTRYCSAIPLVSKSDVFQTISHLLDIEAKRIGYYPSIIHSDRGTEFTNSQLQDYCKKNVIRSRFSDPYTPQLNGLAERFNRTILESLRTILLDSGLNRNLWSEVISASTFTLNQIPNHKSKKSPYELFKNHSVPLSYLRPIGNPVTFLLPEIKITSKLSPKGEIGSLIGYQPELLSYRILTKDNRIINTKNVSFLDFKPSTENINSSSVDDLIVEKPLQPLTKAINSEFQSNHRETIEIKEEESDENTITTDTYETPAEQSLENFSSNESDSDVELNLIPSTTSGRQLRERTLQVKPVKYSYLSEDPKSFKKAINCEDSQEWKAAINEELENIEKHQVWTDCFQKPEKFLRSVWVFRTKPETSSSPEKKKARLCIQGFLQTPGIDFDETFAPTGKFPSLLSILVLALDLNLPVKQFDVKSAFLFAPLKEDIYILTPEGSNQKSHYLKLKKSLYGLKQAPMNWYNTLTNWFKEIDYSQSNSDACLFIHKNHNSFIFFHVDDLIVVGNIDFFEKAFLTRFPNSSAHSPDTLLGMNLNISKKRIELSQASLIKKGLELLNLNNSNSVKTPLSPSIQLHTATEQDHEDFLKLNINYRSYTGILNYLACRTRPDLAPAVSILSRFNNKPGLTHWKQVLHCWKYLKGTTNFNLLLEPSSSNNSNQLLFFTDATWAEDQETRISQSGSIVFWKNCPISWNSKKQKNITLSSTESEMNALSDGEQENQWLTSLIEELWNIKLDSTIFCVDNKGLMEKLKNFGSNSKTKHLDIKIKHLRELFKNNKIDVKLIKSEEMVADSLTKASTFSSLELLTKKCFSVLSSSNMEGC